MILQIELTTHETTPSQEKCHLYDRAALRPDLKTRLTFLGSLQFSGETVDREFVEPHITNLYPLLTFFPQVNTPISHPTPGFRLLAQLPSERTDRDPQQLYNRFVKLC